jgi:hypothetical protein
VNTSTSTSISIGLSFLSSVGARYLISENKQIPKQQAFIFNTIDITVNTLITPYFMRGIWGAMGPQVAVLAARTISWLCAAAITTVYMGPIKLSHTVALSAISLTIGLIVRIGTVDWDKEEDKKLDQFLAV